MVYWKNKLALLQKTGTEGLVIPPRKTEVPISRIFPYCECRRKFYIKTSRFSDAQIIAILNQAEAGSPVPALCREPSISSVTFYKWRSKYGGMDASLLSYRDNGNSDQKVGDNRMITLITGTPSTGKTLRSVELLAELRDSDDPKNRSRLIFSTITDLAKIGVVAKFDPLLWMDLPVGSLIVVDEFQDFWPSRPSGSKCPESVVALNTHRHRTIDIDCILMTPRSDRPGHPSVGRPPLARVLPPGAGA